MKKNGLLKCLLLAVVLALGTMLGACGGDGNGGTPPVVPTDAPTVVRPTRTVTESKLTVYDGPSLMDSSAALRAYVEGTELFVYDTRVNHGRVFTWAAPSTKNRVVVFDFEGKVHMRVEVPSATALTDVVIRPLSYGITPTVTGNTVEFDLEYSANYVLEYNDGKVTDAADNALHIFANPIEQNPISSDSVPQNTIYLGPGIYSAGAIPLASGQTLYLAGGAYVYGQIRMEGLENVTIRGRGIIDGEIFTRTGAADYTLPIEIRFCENVKIEGISILDPAGWAVTLYHSKDIEIDNLKIITARPNGDGISVQSCENVTVKGGFVRTWDDSLVVKNTDRGNTKNVTFDNVVVWTDLAQSMEVGFETNGATMDGITFKNITVVHNYHKAAMSIHNSDDAVITNVLYQSITIEDAKMLGDNRIDGENDFLIDITIAYNAEWSKSDTRGSINGVTFENIKVLDIEDTIISRINGEGNSNLAQNINIFGVEIEGEQAASIADLKIVNNSFARNINVAAVDYDVFGAGVELPYNLALTGTAVDKTVVPTRTQQGLEVPDFAILEVPETYMGVARDLSSATVTVTHGKGTTVSAEYDDGSGSYESAAGEIAKLYDGNRSTEFTAKGWTGEVDEFVAVTLDFGEQLPAGAASVIRVYLAETSAYVYDFTVSVHSRSSTGAYPRRSNAQKYSASPANGNYFDIKLSSSEAPTALQLRFFRVSGMTGQPALKISEIKVYPCSLSTNKSIVDSTEYFDVYKPSNLVDGDNNTYWETSPSDCDGAFFTVDLDGVYNVKYISMHLPPLLTWEARTQAIEILSSRDGITFTTIVARAEYLFDPATGNTISITLDNPVEARYIKLLWSTNSSSRYGAQLSELYIYGV